MGVPYCEYSDLVILRPVHPMTDFVGERGQRNRIARRQAITVACMSAVTVLAGVCVFAYRTENTFIGDAEISSSAVLLAGVLTLVPLISWTAYCTMRRSQEMVLPVGVVSISVGVVTALVVPPGNMFLLGWFMIIAVAVPLLLFTEAVIHRLTTRR